MRRGERGERPAFTVAMACLPVDCKRFPEDRQGFPRNPIEKSHPLRASRRPWEDAVSPRTTRRLASVAPPVWSLA